VCPQRGQARLIVCRLFSVLSAANMKLLLGHISGKCSSPLFILSHPPGKNPHWNGVWHVSGVYALFAGQTFAIS
jgi:hypothetical protein